MGEVNIKWHKWVFLFVNDLKQHLDVQYQGLKLLKQMCSETGDKILENSCNIFFLNVC